MKNRFKNKLWYFLPMLLVLIYARPVEAIFYEFDNEWCSLAAWLIYFMPILLLSYFIFLGFLIVDILFLSKKKKFIKMFLIYSMLLFALVCVMIFLSRNLIVNYFEISGIGELINDFGQDFCYEKGKGG